MVNPFKMCIDKLDQDTSYSTRSVDTQLDVKLHQVISVTTDSHRSRDERLASKSYVPNKKSRKKVSSAPVLQMEVGRKRLSISIARLNLFLARKTT